MFDRRWWREARRKLKRIRIIVLIGINRPSFIAILARIDIVIRDILLFCALSMLSVGNLGILLRSILERNAIWSLEILLHHAECRLLSTLIAVQFNILVLCLLELVTKTLWLQILFLK